jgi:hypothetical protein
MVSNIRIEHICILFLSVQLKGNGNTHLVGLVFVSSGYDIRDGCLFEVVSRASVEG